MGYRDRILILIYRVRQKLGIASSACYSIPTGGGGGEF